MSWLAKLLIEPEWAASKHLELADGYSWHQLAWQAFPDLDGQPRPFLSRLDSGPDGYSLLLLSKDHEPQRPGWCSEDYWEIKTIAPHFLHHHHYRFDLRANPTRKIPKPTPDGGRAKNGRRQPLTGLVEQTDWLQRKAEQSGFKIIEAPEIGFCQDQVFRKRSGRGVHTGVRFRGMLAVTHQENFETAFYRGLGSAKGFGFGLLLLQPINYNPISQ